MSSMPAPKAYVLTPASKSSVLSLSSVLSVSSVPSSAVLKLSIDSYSLGSMSRSLTPIYHFSDYSPISFCWGLCRDTQPRQNYAHIQERARQMPPHISHQPDKTMRRSKTPARNIPPQKLGKSAKTASRVSKSRSSPENAANCFKNPRKTHYSRRYFPQLYPTICPYRGIYPGGWCDVNAVPRGTLKRRWAP